MQTTTVNNNNNNNCQQGLRLCAARLISSESATPQRSLVPTRRRDPAVELVQWCGSQLATQCAGNKFSTLVNRAFD
jgi:hypothetical protein